MKNIFFIGMRGAGKSTIGKLLSQQFKMKYRDLDEEIVQKEGRTIPRIVEEEGWEGFRKKEKEILRAVCMQQDQIVSTGGGVVLSRDNGKQMKNSGKIIFLFAEQETLAERLEGEMDMRPALTEQSLSEEIQSVWGKRKELYHEFADITINTEKLSPDEILDQIIKKLDLS